MRILSKKNLEIICFSNSTFALSWALLNTNGSIVHFLFVFFSSLLWILLFSGLLLFLPASNITRADQSRRSVSFLMPLCLVVIAPVLSIVWGMFLLDLSILYFLQNIIFLLGLLLSVLLRGFNYSIKENEASSRLAITLFLTEEEVTPHCFHKSLIFIVLGILLGVGFLLRLVSVSRGLPYGYNWDEPLIYSLATEMLKNKTFNPHFFNYPSVVINLQYFVLTISSFFAKAYGLISSVSELKTIPEAGYDFIISRSFVPYYGRLFHAALSTVSIVFVFLIGKNVRGTLTGLIAATLLSFNAFYIDHSTWATTDFITAFFSIVWALLLSLFFKTNHLKWFFASAVVAGLTVSCKYNAIPIGVPTLCLIALFAPSNLKIRYILFTLLFIFMGAVLGTPFSLFDFQNFVTGMTTEFVHYAIRGHNTPNTFLSKLWGDFSFLEENVRPHFAVFLFLPVFILQFLKHRSRASLGWIMLYPFLYFLMMAKMKTDFKRNLLLITPFVAIATGYSCSIVFDLLYSFLRKNRRNFKLQYLNLIFKCLSLLVVLILLKSQMPNPLQLLHEVKATGNDSRSLIVNFLIEKKLPSVEQKVFVTTESYVHLEDFLRLNDFMLGSIVMLNPNFVTKNKIRYVMTSLLIEHPHFIQSAFQRLAAANCQQVIRLGDGGPVRPSYPSVNPAAVVFDLNGCTAALSP